MKCMCMNIYKCSNRNVDFYRPSHLIFYALYTLHTLHYQFYYTSYSTKDLIAMVVMQM